MLFLTQYEISVRDARDHFIQVRMHLDARGPETVLRMPAWIPGSYMVRDFARHVRRLRASAAVGRRGAHLPLRITELDKDSWALDSSALAAGTVILVDYEVYAYDASVRTAWCDSQRCFFNASSVAFAVVGREAQACEITIQPVQGLPGARLATGLGPVKRDRAGFGRYRAKDYDELIDCPVEIAAFDDFSFKAGGAEHRFVISGAHRGDLERLKTDVTRICEAQCRFFEPDSGRAPFGRYVFMLAVLGNGYGGLEHRNSTALICSRADLEPGSEGYDTLLGLISHEYFHSWNVKRIKPQAFAPYPLQHEAYTRLLWVFEGLTSYYDDLLLLRSGVFTREQYLKALAKTITQVSNQAGRAYQSLESSSFFAWTKYYKQDENSPNSIVSYYTKGALAGLCLDLRIRLASGHRKSLDDVMRYLWQQYGRDFERDGRGLPEGGFGAAVLAATGLDLSEEMAAWTQGTQELPLATLLEQAGVMLQLEAQTHLESRLGARWRSHPAGIEIVQVRSDSAAQASGLAAGDLVIACDGLRVGEQVLLKCLERMERDAATDIELLAFRHDALLRLQLCSGTARLQKAQLTAAAKPARAALAARRAWLGS